MCNFSDRIVEKDDLVKGATYQLVFNRKDLLRSEKDGVCLIRYEGELSMSGNHYLVYYETDNLKEKNLLVSYGYGTFWGFRYVS